MPRLLMTAVLALALCAAGAGQPPVAPAGEPPTHIEELEKAGEALTQGKGDEAYKLIQEAVRRFPALPPPRVILGRMVVQRIDNRQGRQILEGAAAETPDHPDVYLTFAA